MDRAAPGDNQWSSHDATTLKAKGGSLTSRNALPVETGSLRRFYRRQGRGQEEPCVQAVIIVGHHQPYNRAARRL